MNKHDWYGIAPKDRLSLILDLLNKGYTAEDLNNYFDVKTKRVIADFMNSKGYSKRNNTYVLVPKDDNISSIQMYDNNIPMAHKASNNAGVIQMNDNNMTILFDIINNHERINKMLEWFETKEIEGKEDHYSNESIIEIIDTSLPILKLEGEIKRTTIRVNKNILNEFNSLWKEKFNEYKHQDLLAIALKMFIDKYK
ncbi:hypothetical protein VOH94_002911 [Clostridium perfringens]